MKKAYIGNFILILLILFSCGGSSDNVEDFDLPSNLVIEAILEGTDASNPNGNGSGSITLNFSAANATLYKINFGDGETIETSNNSVTHTYVGNGINNFTIYVSAYNGQKFISTSTQISIKINTSLVWSDEFNSNGAPNSSNWTYDLGAGGWGNNEAQTYTKDAANVTVQGGFLKITAKSDGNGGYTSARLKSQGLQSFKYGRVDVRAKLPASQGTWPAIWMLGDSFSTVGWPHCGEIDIMEQTGWDKETTLGTLHWYNTAGSNNASYGTTTTVANSTSEFHIYSLEWNENTLKIYVDEVEFFVMNNDAALPFNDKFFIILNVAMGGSLGGNIPNDFSQSSMEIDYVRVYQ
jgi:beta-glucanase (GH16 family)